MQISPRVPFRMVALVVAAAAATKSALRGAELARYASVSIQPDVIEPNPPGAILAGFRLEHEDCAHEDENLKREHDPNDELGIPVAEGPAFWIITQ